MRPGLPAHRLALGRAERRLLYLARPIDRKDRLTEKRQWLRLLQPLLAQRTMEQPRVCTVNSEPGWYLSAQDLEDGAPLLSPPDTVRVLLGGSRGAGTRLSQSAMQAFFFSLSRCLTRKNRTLTQFLN